MTKSIYILISILAIVGVGWGQGEVWVDLGQIATDAIYTIEDVGGGIVIAGDGDGHIFRSIDYGANWTDLGAQHLDVVFSITNAGSGIVVASGKNWITFYDTTIIRSTDYGATWGYAVRPYGQSIVYSVESLGDSIVLAGTYSSGFILRSIDYGVTWDSIGRPYNMGAQPEIRSLCNVGNGVALAGPYVTATGYDAYICRSVDYGVTWDSIGNSLGLLAVMSFETLGNGVVLAGSANSGVILRSTDSGSTWSSLGQQYSQNFIYSIANMGGGIVVAGTSRTVSNGQILRSTDYGVTWDSLGQQFGQTSIRSVKYLGNGIAVAGTSGGRILRSVYSVPQCDTLTIGILNDACGGVPITVGTVDDHCGTFLTY
ncbi:MAG TPA: hypothetical protein VJ327_10960 [Patescibacteria group bacterium]|nr:hypothetical protein [Patescibacteria group bacterium]